MRVTTKWCLVNLPFMNLFALLNGLDLRDLGRAVCDGNDRLVDC